MTQPDIRLGVGVEGTAQAVQDLTAVGQAQRSVEEGSRRAATTTAAGARSTTTAVGAMGTAATAAGQRFGQVSSSLGQMGSVLSGLNPTLGRAGQALSAVGGAAGGLAGSMGPLGVVLGVVTAAVGLMNMAFAHQTEQLTTARTAARALTRSYQDLVTAAQSAIDRSELARRLDAGEGTLAEQRGFTQQARQRSELAQRALGGDSGALVELRAAGLTGVMQTEPTIADRLGALGTDLTTGSRLGTTSALSMTDAERTLITGMVAAANRLTDQRASLETGAQARYDRTGDDSGTGGTHASGGMTPDQRRDAHDAFLEAQRMAQVDLDMQQEAFDRAARTRQEEADREEMAQLQAKSDLQVAAAHEAADAQREIQQQAHAEWMEQQREMQEALGAFNDGYVTSIDQVVETWTRANAAIRSSGGQILSSGRLMERGMVAVGNNIAESIGGTMKGAFDQALGAWLSGSLSFIEAAEQMAKGVIKALTQEAIVQTIVELARGIADTASAITGNPLAAASAAAHFAAAAAWGAVGAAAGAIGAATGAFGGGGGQGASSAATGTKDVGGADRQDMSGQPIVINIYPGMLSSDREIAAGLVGGLNKAARYGYTLDTRLTR